ncbi:MULTISPECIES: hypothetical protein [Natronorubrum]|uniref:Uncharacterized protein n=1 Tax=Natronorubrum bangense JCM 10635 TaxID=1227500 RepID=L9WMM4_9EURY|nr:hypothetical protein [Natronorubrum bangense]ELY50719.1 hypothetical protein C494_05070 [Natronorubrum bangense JCM 10635]
MIGLFRTVPLRGLGQTLVPFLLAIAVVVLGTFVYLELVGILLEFVE